MSPFRRLFYRHRVVAAWLVALVLAMKVLIPAGFMPAAANGTIVVQICSGTGLQAMVMTLPGMNHDDQGKGSPHQQAEMPCPFAGLSAPPLAAADAILLAAAILFTMALAARPLVQRGASGRSYLRPPLRGPPTAA